MWLYFVESHTQSEIAAMLGLNRVAVVRLIADARRRNEVRITLSAPLAELAGIEQAVQERYDISRVIAAPVSNAGIDPVKVIAAAAGIFINSTMRPSMTVGVGWGRTLFNSLPFIAGRTLEDFRVVSLLGGIAAARRFNPAEFAWQFAELFQGEGYLIPAPAIVDSPETKHALLEHCGLAEIFQMADHLDAGAAVGRQHEPGSPPATGWATSRRRSAASSSRPGRSATCSTTSSTSRGAWSTTRSTAGSCRSTCARLRKTPERVLVSGGAEKLPVLRGAIKALSPTVLITDETHRCGPRGRRERLL